MTDDDDNSVLGFPHFERLDFNRAVEALGLDGRYYILVGRETVAANMATWAMEFERRYRHIATTGVDPWGVDRTEFSNAHISTVFLGIDHNHFGKGPPLLFETMIFGGRMDDYQNRCSTWDEAEAMHAEAVALARTGHLKVIK